MREALQANGIEVWWDGDLLPGQDWEHEIDSAMSNSNRVVLCLSNALDSRDQSGVYPELHKAIEKYRNLRPGTVYLIPVRIDECSIPSVKIDSTKKLSDLHPVDYFGNEKEAGLVRLLDAIRS